MKNEIMKNNINYKGVTTITLILCVIAIVSFYFYKNNINVKRNNTLPDNTLTFIKKKYLVDGAEDATQPVYDEIDVPQLAKSSDKYIKEKDIDGNIKDVNRFIIDDFAKHQCPDIESENATDTNRLYEVHNSIDDIYNDIDSRFKVKPYSKGNSSTQLSKEDKLLSIQQAGRASVWYATTTLLNKDIFSLSINVQSDCGGAHPNYRSYGLNYFINKDNGVSTSTVIALIDIFKNYDKDKKEIKDIILNEVRKKYKASEDAGGTCIEGISQIYEREIEYEDDYKNDHSYTVHPFDFSLSKDSIDILAFGLPHADLACEPGLGGGSMTNMKEYRLVISYSKLSKYLKPEFLRLMK